MKKSFKSILCVAAAAMTLVSCGVKEIAPEVKPEGKVVYFGTEVNDLTKASLTTEDDKNFVANWENNDVLNVSGFVFNEWNSDFSGTWDAEKNAFAVTGADDYFDDTNDFIGVYPQAVEGVIDFGSARTQDGNNYAGKYDVMCSEATSLTLVEDETFVLPMDRQTAIAYFHLTSTLPEEEKVVSATLSVNENLAGSFIYDKGEIEPDATENSITLSFTNAPSVRDLKLWFNVFPGEYTGLTLEVETENHTLTIKNNKTVTYEQGMLYKVAANATAKYELKAKEVTIEDFLPKEDNADVDYKVTAKVTAITNTTFGNLTIEDQTGTLSVYGLTATKTADRGNDQSFASLELKVGDVITICGPHGTYKGNVQIGSTFDGTAVPAYYVSTLEVPSVVAEGIVDVPAAGVDSEIQDATYTAVDGWDYAVTVDGTVVTAAELDSEGILYSVSANTGAARNGWIKYTFTNLACLYQHVQTIPVTQLSGIAPGNVTYTLSFTRDNNASNYITERTVTCDDISWKLSGNQSIGDYLRVGGKNTTATDRTITSQSAIEGEISYIVINHSGIGNGSNSAITINSFSIEASTTSTFTAETTEKVTTTEFSVSEAGALTIPFEDSHENCYYRVTMNYQITGSNNCYLTVNNIQFWIGAVAPKYNVTISEGIVGGSVTASVAKAKAGTTVTLSPVANPGYEFSSWNVTSDGNTVTVTDNKFEMPAGDVVVSATFTAKQTYPISLTQPIVGGTIAANLENAWEGQEVTLSATPEDNYGLAEWTVTYGSENTPVSVTNNKFIMPAGNVKVTATFAVVYNLTVAPMTPTKKASAAGSHEFTVTTNTTDWTVSVPGDQSWASVEKGNSKFTVSYTANESDSETTLERSVVITVASEQAGLTGENALKITLVQDGKEYIAPGTGYNLVTDASDLSAGMIIVLGCAEKSKVAGALGGNAYLSDQDANISEGVLTSNNAIEFTLGGSSAAWTLTSEEGQLGATAAKKMSSDPSVDNYVGTWTITIDGDGNASITSTTSGYGTIKYNATSPRFLNYASGQTDIQIYAKDDGLENRNLAFSANSDTKDIKDGTSVSVLGLNGVTDGTRSYKSSDETVATITNDGAITLLSEGTTTISVSIAKNETYRAGSASYTLTVRDTRESCARPTASHDAGGVDKNTPVTLSCTTPNAKIYYRVGTTGDFTQYSSAITIDAAKTIYAYAEAPGYKRSTTASFAYTINGGGSLEIDFEGSSISTTNWSVNNITSGQTTITAHSGSKHGKIASTSGYIQTKNKINNPSTFVCYVSKSTNNTTTSSWKVQYSANGTNWTDVKEQSATSMSKGTWVEINTNFPENLGEVYVRIYYSGSNAVRCIDDLVITY